MWHTDDTRKYLNVIAITISLNRLTPVIGILMTILLSTTSFEYSKPARGTIIPQTSTIRVIYAQKYTMIGFKMTGWLALIFIFFSVGVKSVPCVWALGPPVL